MKYDVTCKHVITKFITLTVEADSRLDATDKAEVLMENPSTWKQATPAADSPEAVVLFVEEA